MTIVIKQVNDLKNVLAKAERSIGFVPTMGALHDGHISLIKAAELDCKTTVVSIFINPLQFGPTEDYEKYPRNLSDDLRICEENKVDFVFIPDEKEIYPSADFKPIVPPERLASDLCGRTRENHFRGVATVVKRFFDIVCPDYAYFGEKDLQQLYLIRWLVKEFKLPIFIRAGLTIRESDGLACSSRNRYLTDRERKLAPVLYKSLVLAKRDVHSGIFTVNKAMLEGLISLAKYPEIKVEYFEARDKESFGKVDENKMKSFYFLIAARIGNVRLIDNIEV